ncbi:unnamed protein product, partial [Brachionus calyciflorus]
MLKLLINVSIIFLSFEIILSDKSAIKLTFEVENNEQFCLFHKFNNSIEYMFKYGVLKGGYLDIDFFLESPIGKRVYSGSKIRKLDVFNFQSTQIGVYKFCFSNSFSTISHKVVFFELRPLDPRYIDTLRKESDTNIPFAFTSHENSLEKIHKFMETVSEIQIFHKHEKTIGSNFAEIISQR